MFRIAQRLLPLFWRDYQPTPAPIDQPPDEKERNDADGGSINLNSDP
jgi:hypothetical protein